VAGNAKRREGVSYAGREPDLRRSAPQSLRQAQALPSPFDHARDPTISAQLKDMEKTEGQRRKKSAGRGSGMVRKDRLRPTLKPKYERGPDRAAFNQSWLQEQRAARLASYREEHAACEQDQAPVLERTARASGWER